MKCKYCGKSKSKKGKEFNSHTIQLHIRDAHMNKRENIPSPDDCFALDMADLIAGDESDGVYWGIAHEFGYFG